MASMDPRKSQSTEAPGPRTFTDPKVPQSALREADGRSPTSWQLRVLEVFVVCEFLLFSTGIVRSCLQPCMRWLDSLSAVRSLVSPS
jgi:hypothetical protein